MRITLPLEPITPSNSAFKVPEDAVLSLGGGKRPPVLVTVNGAQIQTRITPMGGSYLIGLTKANYALTGVRDGESYELEIVLDTAERTIETPEPLAAELRDDPAARAVWDGWSFTRRKEAARSLTEAKQQATRERRLAKILASLRAEGTA